MIERVKVEEYDGTMESAQRLILALNLSTHEYFVNVLEKSIYVIKQGIVFFPGDNYHYRLPEEFKVVS